MAHLANKKNNVGTLKLGLGLTFLLGCAFCVFQWLGWQQLVSQGVFLSGGNTSGSIFYVITGGHALHVLVGLVFMLIAVIRSFWLFDRNKFTDTYLDKKNDKLRLRTDLLTVYWHFMGLLWLYLFIFLNVQ
jgi:cytochrome c oxidase subunit 3